MPIVDRLIRLANNASTDAKAVTRQINSTSMSSATVEVVLDNPKSQYTSGDVLSGEVIIRLQKEIDVTEVTLKYKVDEHTELIQPETEVKVTGNQKRDAREAKEAARRNRDGRNDRVFKSEKRIFESAVKLFPSEEVAKHLSGKLTLPQGTHKYPFSIRIPVNRALPPTFTDSENKATIYHHLKATLRRSSALKQNARYELPLDFTPSVNSELVNGRSSEAADFTLGTKGLFNRSSSSAQIVASAPKYAVLGKQFAIDAKLRTDTATVHGGTVELTAFYDIKAQQRKESKSQSELLYDLGQVRLQGSNIDLAPLLGNLVLPQSGIPSFQTAFISVAYGLTLTLYIGRGNDRPDKYSVVIPVTLVGKLIQPQAGASTVSPVPVMPPRPSAYPNEKASYATQDTSFASTSASAGTQTSQATTSTEPTLNSNNPFSPQWTGSTQQSTTQPKEDAPPAYYD